MLGSVRRGRWEGRGPGRGLASASAPGAAGFTPVLLALAPGRAASSPVLAFALETPSRLLCRHLGPAVPVPLCLRLSVAPVASFLLLLTQLLVTRPWVGVGCRRCFPLAGSEWQ